MSYLGSKAVKGLAAGIGLVSESISAHKAKKVQQTQLSEEDNQPTRSLSEGSTRNSMSMKTDIPPKREPR
jgi:hypothetical protein